VKINSDYRDLLHILNEERVRYLIVGGYAWMAHREPRYTKDLDIWIEPTQDNAVSLLKALARFGAPTNDVSVSDFIEPEVFFQIGVEPVRIDLMTSVSGLQFAEAWKARVVVDFDGVAAAVLSWDDVRRAKIASDRKRDRADLRKARGRNADLETR
jgi:hypothetical protein